MVWPFILICSMQFHARSLERKELLRKNNTFYTISRQQLDQTYMLVYRSSPVLRTLDPVWSPVEIDKSTLCGISAAFSLKAYIRYRRARRPGNKDRSISLQAKREPRIDWVLYHHFCRSSLQEEPRFRAHQSQRFVPTSSLDTPKREYQEGGSKLEYY